MGDLLWCLKTKPKILGSRTVPASHRFAIRDPVKGIIDLGGEEAFRVKLQHLCRRQLLRIKSPPPCSVLESGGANQRSHAQKVQEAGYRIQKGHRSIGSGRRRLAQKSLRKELETPCSSLRSTAAFYILAAAAEARIISSGRLCCWDWNYFAERRRPRLQ